MDFQSESDELRSSTTFSSLFFAASAASFIFLIMSLATKNMPNVWALHTLINKLHLKITLNIKKEKWIY